MRIALMQHKIDMLEIPSTYEINYMKIRHYWVYLNKMFTKIKQQILSKMNMQKDGEKV